MADRQRLFFALWPDPPQRAVLQALCQALPPGAGKAVPPDRLHLTLQFLGELDPAQRSAAAAAAAGVRGAPFEWVLDRVERSRQAGVTWATGAPVPGLTALWQALTAALAAAGVPHETRPLLPHVTLARRARTAFSRPLTPALRWPAREFALVHSQAQPMSHYRVITTWPLTE